MVNTVLYFKSAVAGMVALLLFVALLCTIAIGAIFIAGGGDGFDIPVVHLHASSVAVLILVFVAGFYFKRRRLSKVQPRSGGIR